MSVVYEAPRTRDRKEHKHTVALPVTGSGFREPQPDYSTDNGANASKAFRHVVLGINSVLILVLVGISAYLLQSPKTNVFCQADHSDEDCQTFDAVLSRLKTAETEVATLKSALANAEMNITISRTEPIVNGNWSEWGSWSTCSQTCGSGVTTRFRHCDNPALSSSGTTCIGNPMEADSCKIAVCSDRAVGFSVTFPKSSSPADQMAFSNIITNEGGAFNPSTGVFTCPVAGTYFILANLLKNKESTGVGFGCRLYHDDGYPTSSLRITDVSAFLTRMTVGDTIRLRDCTKPIGKVFSGFSSFSAFLVTPDG